MLLKKNWLLVFSFMDLVSVDPMDRSNETKNCEKPTVWNVEGRRTGIELPFCFSNSKTS